MKISPLSTPWLGLSQGYLSDWVTQRWVQLTGHSVNLAQEKWLAGPMGKPTGIGKNFFQELAQESGLEVNASSPGRGLLHNFRDLASLAFDANAVAVGVVDFYEHTANYDLDV